jgi:hypothetical protein
MGGEESAAVLSPQPPVNNFVAAGQAAVFSWLFDCIDRYPFGGFPAPAGQVC